MEVIGVVIVILSLVFSTCGQNAAFQFENDCYFVGATLAMKAYYTGTGSPLSIEWSYSNDTDNLIIEASNCTVFGKKPAGFPELDRITYNCPATDDTFDLSITNLHDAELDSKWGATFTPPVNSTPTPVMNAVPKCECGCLSLNRCDFSKEQCAGSWLGLVVAIIAVIIVTVILILKFVVGVKLPIGSKAEKSTPGKPQLLPDEEKPDRVRGDTKQTTLHIKEGSADYTKEKPPSKLKELDEAGSERHHIRGRPLPEIGKYNKT